MPDSHNSLAGHRPLVSIGEAARIFGVNPRTLRRWEADGKIRSQRTLGGHRRYDRADIEAVAAGRAA
jgi:excisionase family DNA binding protein